MGMNYEVAPRSRLNFKFVMWGDVCHDLLMLRYLLTRLKFEKHNVIPNFEPKPVENENGSGCHMNLGTIQMRYEKDKTNLMKTAETMCKKLKASHEHFIDNVWGNK